MPINTYTLAGNYFEILIVLFNSYFLCTIKFKKIFIGGSPQPSIISPSCSTVVCAYCIVHVDRRQSMFGSSGREIDDDGHGCWTYSG